MQIPILSGIYTDAAGDFRSGYPRNMVPVPKAQGISQGYLRPADGIEPFATGPGAYRGGIEWRGTLYAVMGAKLCSVSASGVVTELGDVGQGGRCRFDYSFDRLGIASGGRLYYWNGSALSQVTDPDIGSVVDMLWVDGYWMTTDGEYIPVTELNDPASVNPLKYGSSEADPDPVLALRKLRGEVYVLNRHSIEAFQNVGGTGFPFARIEGAQVSRGCVGTHAACLYADSIAFVGSGRNEAVGVHLLGSGTTAKLSTREIDQILGEYSEAELSGVLLEARIDKGHQHLLLHLPDRALVYDVAASQAMQEPVWFILTSSTAERGQYRAQGLVRCYDRWFAGDPQASRIGELVPGVSTHYGEPVGWEFSTQILYNEGRGAIVHQLELVCLPGRVALGAEPVVWCSYSGDGMTWSQERPRSVGSRGERDKRIAWFRQGRMSHWRILRFRGTSDAHLSVARLEAQLEPLDG